LKGSYFMDGAGNTSSDQRLTQEATFTLRIETPTISTLPANASIGSIWLSYKVTMKDPNIKIPFAGSCDTWIQHGPFTGASLNSVGATHSYTTTPLPSNNLGTVLPDVDGPPEWAYIIPPGVYVMQTKLVNARPNNTLTVYTTNLKEFRCTKPYLAANWVDNGYANGGTVSASNVLQTGSPFLYSTTTLAEHNMDMGVRFVVPNDGLIHAYGYDTTLWSDNLIGVGVPVNVISATTSITSIFSNPEEAQQIGSLSDPNQGMYTRLDELEEQLALMLEEKLEGKESKEPITSKASLQRKLTMLRARRSGEDPVVKLNLNNDDSKTPSGQVDPPHPSDDEEVDWRAANRMLMQSAPSRVSSLKSRKELSAR